MNTLNVMLDTGKTAPASSSGKTVAVQGSDPKASFQARLTKTQAAAQQDAEAPDPKQTSFNTTTAQTPVQNQAQGADVQTQQATATQAKSNVASQVQSAAGKQTTAKAAANAEQDAAEDEAALAQQTSALPWAQLMTLVQQLLTPQDTPVQTAAGQQSPSSQLLTQLTGQTAAQSTAAGQTLMAQLSQVGSGQLQSLLTAWQQSEPETVTAVLQALNQSDAGQVTQLLTQLVPTDSKLAQSLAELLPTTTANQTATPQVAAEQLLQALTGQSTSQSGVAELLAALPQTVTLQQTSTVTQAAAAASGSATTLQALLQQGTQAEDDAVLAPQTVQQTAVQTVAAEAADVTPAVEARTGTATAQTAATAHETAAQQVQTAVPQAPAAVPVQTAQTMQTAQNAPADNQTQPATAQAPVVSTVSGQQFTSDSQSQDQPQDNGQSLNMPLPNIQTASTMSGSDAGAAAGISAFAQQLQQTTDTPQVSQPQTPVQQNYQVPEQIVDQARLLRRGEDTQMVIHLKPEHLGDLTLKVAVGADGAVNASFHSNNAEVRTIIQNSLAALRQELNNQGLRVDNVDVYAGLEGGLPQQDSSQQGWQQQGSNQQNMHSTQESAEAFADEAELNTALAAQQAEAGSASGVDYRV